MQYAPGQTELLRNIRNSVEKISDIIDTSIAAVQFDRYKTRAQNTKRELDDLYLRLAKGHISSDSDEFFDTQNMRLENAFSRAVSTSSSPSSVFYGAVGITNYLDGVLQIVDNPEVSMNHAPLNLVGRIKASQASRKAKEALGYFPIEDLAQIDEGLGAVLEPNLRKSIYYWAKNLQGTDRLLDRDNEAEMTEEQLNETKAVRDCMNLLEEITLKFIQKYTPK